MALDFSKPENLQTRDGREVRIYATDHVGLFCVIGAILEPHGWRLCNWTIDGWAIGVDMKSSSDLIPKPLRVTGWVNVYKGGVFGWTGVSKTREDAAINQGIDCIGQIYIDAEVQT